MWTEVHQCRALGIKMIPHRVPCLWELQAGVGDRDGKTSLVAQMVKNLPAMQETWVRSLDGEDPSEKGMAPGGWLHLSPHPLAFLNPIMAGRGLPHNLYACSPSNESLSALLKILGTLPLASAAFTP